MKNEDDFIIDTNAVISDLYSTLKAMGGEKEFNLNDNALDRLLDCDDDAKFQVLIFLIHEINYNESIKDDLKSDLIGSITVGLNVIFNKKLAEEI
ncbi:TPA: hypothetical protein OTY34_001987 [Pseudomonas aeruginosa]|nr:hypothetical protein [Pseudomonas aeruginosa]